jgi:hypothetical protein
VSARDLGGEEIEALAPEAIYARAAERGRAMGLAYAGALTPHEAYRLHDAGAGFAHAYNVLEGFEGDLDIRRQRGCVGGWRAAGLPWEQS